MSKTRGHKQVHEDVAQTLILPIMVTPVPPLSHLGYLLYDQLKEEEQV